MILLILNVNVLLVFLPVLRFLLDDDNLFLDSDLIREVISYIACIFELLFN